QKRNLAQRHFPATARGVLGVRSWHHLRKAAIFSIRRLGDADSAQFRWLLRSILRYALPHLPPLRNKLGTGGPLAYSRSRHTRNHGIAAKPSAYTSLLHI